MSFKDSKLVQFIGRKLGFDDEDEEEYSDDLELELALKEGEDAESMPEVLRNTTRRRSDFNIFDYREREQYIRSLCDMMAAASSEVEKQKDEYRKVTDRLADLEEIAAMPPTDRNDIKRRAKRIVDIEERESSYRRPVSKITDAQYREMERIEDDIPSALRELKKNEEYQMTVRRDLNLLEGEKGALAYQRKEMHNKAKNSKAFAVIIAVSAGLALLLLMALQFGLRYNVLMGYYFVIAVTAIALTMVYFSYRGALDGEEKSERQINKAISLQNSAKIKYVNVTNLLDYQYSKYNVSNFYELNYMWEKYQEEKAARNHSEEVAKEMEDARISLSNLIGRYHIKDAAMWIFKPDLLIYDEALTDMRHSLIIQRQRLRKGIDFNMFNLDDGKKEIEHIVRDYPKFAKEILAIVDSYE